MSKWTGISIGVGFLAAGCSGAPLDEAVSDEGPLVVSAPDALSLSGLYDDAETEQLAEGVYEYAPRFALWTDGAEKRRFVRVPEGDRIDTSDPDAWVFPVGTRLWKEFRREGVRIETRLLEKTSRDEWFAMAYAWDADGTDAEAVPEGRTDALGTTHDIPRSDACERCHGGASDVVLGFSRLQLSAPDALLSADDLDGDDWLSQALPSVVDGGEADPVATAALGTLHVNCGACHNPSTPIGTTLGMDLSLTLSDLTMPDHSGAYQTAVDGVRIIAGDPDASYIVERMDSREPGLQMPPLGTEVVDAEGLDAVRRWIAGLADPPAAMP